MKTLDNSNWRAAEFARIVSKMGIVVGLMGLAVSAISCQRSASMPAEVPSVRPASEAIAEADGLYAGREDLVKVRQGLIALRQAQASDGANYEVAWKLAKFNYYLGAHSPDSTEQEKSFRDGIAAGKLAVKLQDGKPEGHFWLGANYGGSAKLSVLSGLSDVDDIKREMEAVLRVDEGYQSGSAYMALGQLYLQAPRMLGGDTQKAISYLEKGVKLGPTNALLRVRLAEAYAEANRNDEARREISALMAMKPDTGYEPEHNEAVADARKLEAKIK